MNELQWTTHPLRERRTLGIALLGSGVAIWFAVHDSTGQWLLATVLCLLFFSSFKRFLLPTTYCLDKSGVRITQLGISFSRTWQTLASYSPEKTGLFLSPFHSASRLENFRGLFLLWPADPAPVIAFIQANTTLQRLKP